MSEHSGDDETEFRGSAPLPARQQRFAAGDLIARRFRIVMPLGRGGMGEVYRADDTKLGEPVALKFLPERLAADHGMLDRLIGEVRIGRQVSHPNVCRLYDVGEAENGAAFIAMEYVDGEDLASLLRRIGRIPSDKAAVFAHDIISGLAAAHDAGVIHRDLKPANIMIDSSGRARITDFGLAVVRAEKVLGEFAGTPSYMAPEQLAGALEFLENAVSRGYVADLHITTSRFFAPLRNTPRFEELVARARCTSDELRALMARSASH